MTSPDKDPSDAPKTGPVFADEQALLPAIAQDAEDGRVLMLAFMNQAAYEETLETGRAVYFSRGRNRLWRKGETSGHYQIVKQILLDCDRDTILLLVDQQGPGACHTGHRSCFYRQVSAEGLQEIEPRVYDPEATYGSND